MFNKTKRKLENYIRNLVSLLREENQSNFEDKEFIEHLMDDIGMTCEEAEKYMR